MKERPIIFRADSVRAILDGRKTQTRRLVKGAPLEWIQVHGFAPEFVAHPENDSCRYGKTGDRLWVRERFQRIDGQTQPWIETDYEATYKRGDRLGDLLGDKKQWQPAMFMPRHASRILLTITGLRIERLQEISEADARAEGAPCVDEVSGREVLFPDHAKCGTFKLGFQCLWESHHGPDSWAESPYVWVINFERTTA